MRQKGSHGPWIWPLAVAAMGVVLLLDNYLLLGDFNVVNLWPLLLVVIGAQILLRGDLVPSDDARTFGITRGSVESGTLEISSGAIDVGIRALSSGSERLIAGQYAAQARPALRVDGVRAHLKMDRAFTPWLSFADWEVGVTDDMPWQFYVSTHLGQVNVDLSQLIVDGMAVATGIGDIRLVSPGEAFDPLYVRSSLGNIHIITPPGYRTRVIVSGGRFFGTHCDETRYQEVEPGVFMSIAPDDSSPLSEIHVSGTFGDAYLA